MDRNNTIREMRQGDDTDRCPVCGRECGFLYVRGGETVGCERCVVMLELWEVTPRERG